MWSLYLCMVSRFAGEHTSPPPRLFSDNLSIYAAHFTKKKLFLLATITTKLLRSTINIDEHAWSLRSRRKLLQSRRGIRMLSTCRYHRRAGRPPRQRSGSSSFFRSFTSASMHQTTSKISRLCTSTAKGSDFLSFF